MNVGRVAISLTLWVGTADWFAIAQSTSVAIPAPPPATNNMRAIPDNNLAYPVFVSIGNSTGSGFYVNTDKAVFFVTAKHVLFNPATQLPYAPTAVLVSYSSDLKDPTKNVLTLNLPVLQAKQYLHLHATSDVVAIKVFDVTPLEAPGSFFNKPVEGVSLNSSAKTGILTVGIKGVRTFDQVLIGNDVMVFGYPTSLGLQQSPQLDPMRPLLRKGIVAGTNPATRFLVLDCPVYFGNSGGPVLEIDRQLFGGYFLSIIGVVDQYVPFVQQAGSQTLAMQVETNSGYSLAIPMDYVLELLK